MMLWMRYRTSSRPALAAVALEQSASLLVRTDDDATFPLQPSSPVMQPVGAGSIPDHNRRDDCVTYR